MRKRQFPSDSETFPSHVAVRAALTKGVVCSTERYIIIIMTERRTCIAATLHHALPRVGEATQYHCGRNSIIRRSAISKQGQNPIIIRKQEENTNLVLTQLQIVHRCSGWVAVTGLARPSSSVCLVHSSKPTGQYWQGGI